MAGAADQSQPLMNNPKIPEEPTPTRSVARAMAMAVCVLLQVLEGFDVLVMAVIALRVKQDLVLSTPDLGLVFAAALTGMMLGALCISGFADIYGRRKVIMFCMILATTGLLLASISEDRNQLIAFRFLTGLGVGGAMPVINSAIAELARVGARNLAITISATGYPVGGLIAGLLGTAWLYSHTWRSLLWISGGIAVLAIVLVARFLPEPVAFLLARRPANALQLINESRARLDERPLARLPLPTPEESLAIRTLLTPERLGRLAAYAFGTFCVQFSFYFFLSWLPPLLEQRSRSATGTGSVMLNFGGICGDFLFGILCLRMGVRVLGIAMMLIAFAAVIGLVFVADLPAPALILSLVIGAALFGAMVSVYAMAPLVFPPGIRSSGTGLAFSMGRLGGAISPWLGAFAIGSSTIGAAALPLMAFPLALAAAFFLMIRRL